MLKMCALHYRPMVAFASNALPSCGLHPSALSFLAQCYSVGRYMPSGSLTFLPDFQRVSVEFSFSAMLITLSMVYSWLIGSPTTSLSSACFCLFLMFRECHFKGVTENADNSQRFAGRGAIELPMTA